MPACAITGTLASHSLLQLLDDIEQLVPAAELLAWLVQQRHLEIRFVRLGDGLWRSAVHRDDDSPPRRGNIHITKALEMATSWARPVYRSSTYPAG
jgi:hypothetical protein